MAFDFDQQDLATIQKALRNAVTEVLDLRPVAIGQKWKGGTLVIKPDDPGSASKEMPLESFFHKIVMVRDRLRVLEQQSNKHPKLDDADRVNLHQYITRAYGSLTTFNVLFKEEDDRFVGSRGE